MKDDNSLYLTRSEAAEFIGVDKCTLSRWFSEGLGPPRIKLGRCVLKRSRHVGNDSEWTRLGARIGRGRRRCTM